MKQGKDLAFQDNNYYRSDTIPLLTDYFLGGRNDLLLMKNTSFAFDKWLQKKEFLF